MSSKGTASPELRAYLGEVRPIVAAVIQVPEDEIQLDTDLVEAGFLDSMRALQIISDLERRFDVHISDEEAEDFLSLRAICEGLARLKDS